MGDLSMIRGDSKHYKFQRKDENGDVIPIEADEIYFTVKRSDTTLDPIFQKTKAQMTFDNEGFYHFSILPEDTNNLVYSTYYYDIERIVQGDKKTIAIGKFIVNPEITFARNEVQ